MDRKIDNVKLIKKIYKTRKNIENKY